MLENDIDKGIYTVLGIPTYNWKNKVNTFIKKAIQNAFGENLHLKIYDNTCRSICYIITDLQYPISLYGSFIKSKKYTKPVLNKIAKIINKMLGYTDKSVCIESNYGIGFNIHLTMDEFDKLCQSIDTRKIKSYSYYSNINARFVLKRHKVLSHDQNLFINNISLKLHELLYKEKYYTFPYDTYLDVINGQYMLYIVPGDINELNNKENLLILKDKLKDLLKMEIKKTENYMYLKAVNSKEIENILGLFRLRGTI